MSETRTAIETMKTALVESADATEAFVILIHKDGTRSSYCTTSVAYKRIGLLYSQLVKEEELCRNSDDVEMPPETRQ